MFKGTFTNDVTAISVGDVIFEGPLCIIKKLCSTEIEKMFLLDGDDLGAILQKDTFG